MTIEKRIQNKIDTANDINDSPFATYYTDIKDWEWENKPFSLMMYHH